MHKIITFLRYFKDFVKYKEFRYIFTSLKYLLTKRTTSRTQLIKTSLGTFIVRKGTLDFQFANYAYEWPVKQFYYSHYSEYNVFIDIGSNIGTYAILSANDGMRVYAFEPISSNFKALRLNVILNNLENKIMLFPFALGAKRYKTDFKFDLTNTGASHKADIEPDDNYKPFVEKTLEAEVVPLDEIISELDIKLTDRIFMKIDVEGMEVQVLEGARKFLQTYPNILIVMESVHSGREQLTEILQNIDHFEILEVDNLNMGARKIIK